jgi:hypothetical protein
MEKLAVFMEVVVIMLVVLDLFYFPSIHYLALGV